MHLGQVVTGGLVLSPTLLVHSLYKAQNPAVVSCCLAYEEDNDYVSDVAIGHSYNICPQTSYDCYALSYCLSQSSHEFRLMIVVWTDEDVSLIETFVKGVRDHWKNKPRIIRLQLVSSPILASDKCLLWLMKANFELEELKLEVQDMSDSVGHIFRKSLVKLQLLAIEIASPTSLEWLSALKSLTELQALEISSREQCSAPPCHLHCWPMEHKLSKVAIDINLPYTHLTNFTVKQIHLLTLH